VCCVWFECVCGCGTCVSLTVCVLCGVCVCVTCVCVYSYVQYVLRMCALCVLYVCVLCVCVCVVQWCVCGNTCCVCVCVCASVLCVVCSVSVGVYVCASVLCVVCGVSVSFMCRTCVSLRMGVGNGCVWVAGCYAYKRISNKSLFSCLVGVLQRFYKHNNTFNSLTDPMFNRKSCHFHFWSHHHAQTCPPDEILEPNDPGVQPGAGNFLHHQHKGKILAPVHTR